MSNILGSPQRRKGRKEELFLLSAEKAESKTISFHLPASQRQMKNILSAISAS